MKIIVKPESSNLWWGIYGFCEKIGWEDLNIFDDSDVLIGRFCLNAKNYLRNGVDYLRKNPTESDFVQAIDNYLRDDKFIIGFIIMT